MSKYTTGEICDWRFALHTCHDADCVKGTASKERIRGPEGSTEANLKAYMCSARGLL